MKNQTANSLQALGLQTADANHAILENLRSNRRSTDRPRPLAPNRSSTYANIICLRGRRSRPVQRGATERPPWNERLYLAQIIRLRLRRAELCVVCAVRGVVSEC